MKVQVRLYGSATVIQSEIPDDDVDNFADDAVALYGTSHRVGDVYFVEVRPLGLGHAWKLWRVEVVRTEPLVLSSTECRSTGELR